MDFLHGAVLHGWRKALVALREATSGPEEAATAALGALTNAARLWQEEFRDHTHVVFRMEANDLIAASRDPHGENGLVERALSATLLNESRALILR